MNLKEIIAKMKKESRLPSMNESPKECAKCKRIMSNQPWSVSIKGNIDDIRKEAAENGGTFTLKEPPKYYCEECTPSV